MFLKWLLPGIGFVLAGRALDVVPVDRPRPVSAGLACDLVVDAGPDTSVCAPGGAVQLSGSITGNDLFFEWSPATGLSNPLALNPVATVSATTTYTLTAWAIDPAAPNLVFNGDFENGNTGFTTAYTYVANLPGIQTEMYPEGTYTIVQNPNLVHNGFNACSDHTPGGGTQMMVVNGSSALQNVWCQTVVVSPNTFYDVSAWVASVNPVSPAQLQFSINSTTIGNIVYAPSQTCEWVPFDAVWNSGSATTAQICILNLNTAAGGNDFAIDDIAMYELCKVEDEVTIQLVDEDAPEPVITGPAFACEGELATYSADYPSVPPVLQLEWSLSSGGTILSGQGTPSIIVAWNSTGLHEVCLDLATRCDEDAACFEVEIATLPEIPGIVSPPHICPGATATFYTAEQDPEFIFQWTVPANAILLSGQGTNQIEVGWVSPGQVDICVAVTNACGTVSNCAPLVLAQAYSVLLDTTICEGTSFVFNGTTYGNGVWSGTEYFVTTQGCDSIIQVAVTEASAVIVTVDTTICQGDSYFAGGTEQYQAGVYVDSLTSIGGCDSIVFTTLAIDVPDTTLLLLTTCDPSAADTTIVTVPGTYCDNTVITQITYAPPDTTFLMAASCLPADTGTFVQVFINMQGCDSTVILVTRLDLADTTRLMAIRCTPQDTGTTTTAYTNIHGCDSLVILTTLYGGSDTTNLQAMTCRPADAGLTWITLANIYGCDSILQVTTNLLPSDTIYRALTTCDPQAAGTDSVWLINRFGCDSIVVTSTALLPIDACDIQFSALVIQPPCHADTAFVRIDITVGEPPFILSILQVDSTITIPLGDKGTYTFPIPLDGECRLELSSANGLIATALIEVIRPSPLQLEVRANGDYNGFQVPCHGDQTGRIEGFLLSTGTTPLTYAWSSGQSTLSLENLSAGLYTLTITDSHGCIAIDSARILEPPPLTYSTEILPVRCFGETNGRITILDPAGGVLPWTTSMNGSPFMADLDYSNLGPGTYSLTLRDQNGCGSTEDFFIREPEDWRIDLPGDTILPYGASYVVDLTISGQPASPVNIAWSDGFCPDCLSRTLAPTQSILLEVTVIDANGCTDTDRIRLGIRIDRNLYIPNVFSPNNDGINDRFLISADPAVTLIETMSIYDRWGNAVFEARDFLPNDPSAAWDGTFRGNAMQPAVFAYRMAVQFIDGRRDVFFGDVTLMR